MRPGLSSSECDSACRTAAKIMRRCSLLQRLSASYQCDVGFRDAPLALAPMPHNWPASQMLCAVRLLWLPTP